MPLRDIATAVRGIFAAPQGFREEGLSGVAKSFVNPQPYESSNRVSSALDANQAEIQALDNALTEAQSVNDLAPVMGHFQRIQHELAASGVVSDEGAYNRVLGPIQERIRGKARELALANLGMGGDQPNEGEQATAAIQGGTLANDPSLTRAGMALKDVFRSNAMNQQTQAMLGRYEDQSDLAPYQKDKLIADTDLARARAAHVGDEKGAGTGPKLADEHRILKMLNDAQTDPWSRIYDTKAIKNPQLLEELNTIRSALGKQPYAWVPGRGLQDAGKAAGNVLDGMRRGAENYSPPPGSAAPPSAPPGGGGVGPAPAPPEAPEAPQLQAPPAQRQIQIPPVFEQKAARGELTTTELVRFYMSREGGGMDQAGAVQAARQAAAVLDGRANR